MLPPGDTAGRGCVPCRRWRATKGPSTSSTPAAADANMTFAILGLRVSLPFGAARRGVTRAGAGQNGQRTGGEGAGLGRQQGPSQLVAVNVAANASSTASEAGLPTTGEVDDAVVIRLQHWQRRGASSGQGGACCLDWALRRPPASQARTHRR